MSCVTSLTVSPKSVTLNAGNWYYEAKATVCCSGQCCSDVAWHSEDPCVATVNPSSGYINAVGVGTTKIYATACDGSGCSDYITVTVINTVPITSLAHGLSVMKGDCAILTADILPENSTQRDIIWRSNNESIATVHGGAVHGVSVGTATITATSKFNSKISSSCKVRVTKDIPVTYISVSLSSASVVKGKNVYASEQVYPHNATCRCVTWESSDTTIATVNPVSGTVFTYKAGTVTIRAKAQDGSGIVGEAELTVTAPILAKSVTVCPSTATIYAGGSVQLCAEVYPENTTNKKIRWCSENCYIADVDTYTGCVCGKTPGTTKIRATAQDGSGVYGTCEVTVRSVDVTEISFSETSYTLETIGATKYLYPTISPSNATNKSVTWSSSDDSVVSVNQYGCITAVSTNGGSVASAVITATTKDGGYEASCTVYVDTREKVTVEKDGDFFTMTFNNTGHIWKSIECDLNLDENRSGHELWLEENYYALKPCEQRYVYNFDKAYTVKELAFIFLFDPLGLSYFMENYYLRSDINITNDNDIKNYLEFKDDIYTEIFGITPQRFLISDSGQKITSGLPTNRIEVYTDAELILGKHPILDSSALIENSLNFVQLIFDAASWKYECMSWVSTGIDVVKAIFFSGSIVQVISDKAMEYLEGRIDEKVGVDPKEIFEWAKTLIQTIREFDQIFDDAFNELSSDVEIYNRVSNDNDYRVLLKNGSISVFVKEITEAISQV